MAQSETSDAVAITGNERVAQAISRNHFVLSDGVVTIEPIANLIRFPAGHEEHVIDYHAVAHDSRNRIYVLYNSSKRFPSTRALARFHYVRSESSGHDHFVFDTFLGTREWAEGTIHGLNISRERQIDGTDEEEHLVIVNNDGTIILAGLDGRVHWKRSISADGLHTITCAVAAANAPTIGVVDGYGTYSNFVCSKLSGEILGMTGSKGSGDNQSSTNHGVDLDPDGDFVVADRGNRRLTWWSADTFEPIMIRGTQKKLDMPGLEVCNVSFLGRYAVVPCLNSKLAFLAPDEHTQSGYKVASVIDMPEGLVAAGIDGIHDADFTPDGRYVIVSVWERKRTERQIPTITAFRLNWPELEMAMGT